MQIQHGDVTIDLIGNTVRAYNTLQTLRYFMDLEPPPDDMPFDELIARGVYCALIAHTSDVRGVKQSILDAFNLSKRIRNRADAMSAYSAFMDAVDDEVELYNMWYAAVNQARAPIGDDALQPPTPDNAGTRKKKKS